MATNTPNEIPPETIAAPEGAVPVDGLTKHYTGDDSIGVLAVPRVAVRGTRTKARMVVLGGMLVAVVAVAACGGGSSSSGSTSTTTTTSSTTVAGGAAGSGSLAAFRSCMAGQGITLPQRTGPSSGTPPSTTPGATRPAGGAGGASRFNTPPPGVNAATYQAALNACRSKLPTGGFGGGSSTTPTTIAGA